MLFNNTHSTHSTLNVEMNTYSENKSFLEVSEVRLRQKTTNEKQKQKTNSSFLKFIRFLFCINDCCGDKPCDNRKIVMISNIMYGVVDEHGKCRKE